jgi:hypothetical protein
MIQEVTTKRFSLMALACLGAAAFAPAWAADVPEIPFDSVSNFLKLPTDMYLGEVSGVAVNSKKHIFIFNRGNTTGPAYSATAAQLLEFGPDGKFIREIGKNLYVWSFAHDVRVDKDDNIWAIDKGTDMIIRFNPEGRVTMVFGRKKEASDEGSEPWKHPNPPLPAIDGQFRQPTDVAWDTQGDIFISDGYINSRVAKYDKNGDWVKSFGAPGKEPGQFNTPHGIERRAGQPLRRRPRQCTHSSVRPGRQVPAADQDRCAGSRGREALDGTGAAGQWTGDYAAEYSVDGLHHARPNAVHLYVGCLSGTHL